LGAKILKRWYLFYKNALDSDNELLYSAKLGKKAARDIVQFVPFREYENDPIKLATETLREIPRQFIDYAKQAHLSPELVQRVSCINCFEQAKSQFIDYLGKTVPVNDKVSI
jgi:Copine